MTAPRMLYLGGVLVDLIYRIDRLPSPGTEVTADTADVQVGGGFNTMSAASRNGLAVAYGGAHGRGPHGDATRRSLRAADIVTLQDITPSRDNGTCVVLVTADGERSFVTHAGVESLLTDDQLADVAPRADDWIVLSGYALCRNDSDAAVLRWLSRAPASLPLLFDPSPLVGDIPRTSLDAILARATWLSCNAREAATLSGESDPRRAIETLRARPDLKDLSMILRLGADGCLLAPTGGPPEAIESFPVAVLDSTGAGDAHVGTFVAGLGQGLSPKNAALRANAAGAIVVGRFGGATGPTQREIDEFLATQDIRSEPRPAPARAGAG